MNPQTLKVLGVVSLIICGICAFVAIERYQDNANKVAAMNQMGASFPVPGVGPGKLEPATPAATKYGLVGALVSGAGGIVCFVMAGNAGKRDGTYSEPTV